MSMDSKTVEDLSEPDCHIADRLGYMLGRGYAAASRLNIQFYLWKESLQFNIHLSIQLPNQDIHIADIATGTSTWLMDTARELPRAQLDGYDISLAQAPLEKWLPPNVTLKTWNIFDDVPDSMLARYDLVHARFLVVVVKNSDPRPIMRNLIKMLKPGGYLQWDELNYTDTCVKVTDASLQTTALDELRRIVYSRGRNNWSKKLAEIAGEEGLESVQLYHFEDMLDLARANGEQHLLTMEECASRLVEENNEEGLKMQRLVHDAYQESLEGAALSMPRVVCVARKPS